MTDDKVDKQYLLFDEKNPDARRPSQKRGFSVSDTRKSVRASFINNPAGGNRKQSSTELPQFSDDQRGDFARARRYTELSTRVGVGRDLIKKGKKANKEDLKELKRELEMDEHKIDLKDLLFRYSSDLDKGLTKIKHEERLKRDGPNILTPPKQTPEYVKLAKQLFGGFSLLLWSGSLLCFIAYAVKPTEDAIDNLYLGVTLVIVVVLSALFSYYQESKSDKVMEGFKKMVPYYAVVRRDGEKLKVNATELVVGDIAEVKAGDKIPADLRIVEASNFKVDNSSLTGESEAQSRNGECTSDNPLESHNVAFYSTLAVDGTAVGVVINTGDKTVIGRIATLSTLTKNEETPIHKEIAHFIKIITVVAVVLGVIFVIIGLSNGENAVVVLVFGIGIIVANVPEGLLPTVTVSLTLTANRMAKKFVLVKNLEAVETLGSTTTICSDKTGTLTQNRMTVSHVWYDSAIQTCDTSVTTGSFDKDSTTFKNLYRIAALCNKATFDIDDLAENPQKILRDRKTLGDASESALLKFCESVRNVQNFRDAHAKLAEIPFNSTNKYQLSIHVLEDQKDKRLLLVIKGAPERVFERCTNIEVGGKEIPITDEIKKNFTKAYEKLGSMGERVLGFAHFYLTNIDRNFEFDTDNPNFTTSGYTFMGLISMIDPPRDGVPEAVARCQAAGIKVIMVTGDHPITAKAIAQQVGIITTDTVEDQAEKMGVSVDKIDPESVDAIVIHGTQLKDMTDADLDKILMKKQIVFARTSPQQKLIIVEGCQRRKEVVAVTGDGVNDSPALKKADIGVAMGIAGSDVAKEAADMILLDDNFASIVNGIEEGRLIFDNLKKSIAYTLTSNIPEILPFLLLNVIQLPLAISTVLILCIDLGTDMIPAIALAYEPAESDIMKRRPRNAQTDHLVNPRLISFSYLQIGVIQGLAGLYTYFVVMHTYGIQPYELINNLYNFEKNPDYFLRPEGANLSLEHRLSALQYAQTAYFVSIVVVQYFDLFMSKTRKLSIFQQSLRNYVLFFGWFSETALAAAVCYVPFLNVALKSKPILFVHWLTAIPFGVFMMTYDECRRYFIRKYPGGWVERNTYW